MHMCSEYCIALVHGMEGYGYIRGVERETLLVLKGYSLLTTVYKS